MAVLSQNKSDPLTMVINPQEVDVEYIFGSFSKMTFKIRKYIYNENTLRWEINPCYEYLEKNSILCTSEQTNVFKFKGRSLLQSTDYSIPSSQPNTRNPNNSGLYFNVTGNNFQLKNETLLFNIGATNGYAFKYCSYFDNNGSFIDGIERKEEIVGGRYCYTREAVQEFFPVKVGDIIAMGCKVDNSNHFNTNGTLQFAFRLFFYSEPDSTKMTKKTDWLAYNPVGRYVVSDGDFGEYHYEDMNHHALTEYDQEGYVRIECTSYQNTSTHWIAPSNNYIYIISGERYCSSVTLNSEQTINYGIPYWIIKDTEDFGEGYNSTKTITAYSYEAIVGGRNISVTEDTYPLYIPDGIINKIEGNSSFIIDSVNNTNYLGKQRSKRGIVNIILDELPDWQIGYVSSGLITKYRTIDSCDNTNIYSFLMNTIQELYKCYVLFDTKNNKINLISQSDIISFDSGAMIGWRNALKGLTITNVDEEFATSMYVNAGDNRYGLGVVNPNGSNTIYNFDNVMDRMDYVVDTHHLVNLHDYFNDEEDVTRPQTLKDLWRIYKLRQSRILSGTENHNGIAFRTAINNLIDYQMKLAELETKKSEAYTEYANVANNINILMDWDNSNYPRIPEKPLTLYELTAGSNSDYTPNTNYTNFCSEDLYRKLYNAAYTYNNVANTYTTTKIAVVNTKNYIKDYNTILSLNPKVLRKQFNLMSSGGNVTDGEYKPVFSPNEAIELSKFIIQGIWTNDNVIFKDDYSRDDIVNTLQPIYNSAVSDLANIYSKPVYEFSADIASLVFNEELSKMILNLYLGNSLHIVPDNKRKLFTNIQPVLMSFHINYDNYEESSITLSTNYKQKPWEIRYTQLFGMISQTSVSSPNYTADN